MRPRKALITPSWQIGPWIVPIEDKKDHSLTFRAIRGQTGAIYGRNGMSMGSIGRTGAQIGSLVGGIRYSKI
jgi:hypothetical protein